MIEGRTLQDISGYLVTIGVLVIFLSQQFQEQLPLGVVLGESEPPFEDCQVLVA